jgi:hypothetical protein
MKNFGLKIFKTDSDGTVFTDMDQQTFEDLNDYYDVAYRAAYNQSTFKDPLKKRLEAREKALLEYNDYLINVFLFYNGHIRLVEPNEYED